MPSSSAANAAEKGIKVSDIDDLLREIDASNAVASSTTAGSGGKNIDKGGNTSHAAAVHSSSYGGGLTDVSEAQRRQKAVDAKVSSAVQFSTYVPPPPEILEAGSAADRDRSAAAARAAVGVRLAPLAAVGGGGIGGGDSPGAKPTKGGGYAPMTVDAAAIAEAVRKARGASAEGWGSNANGGANDADDAAAAEEGAVDNAQQFLPNGNAASHLPHVVNFLPVMHARLMTGVAGIVPRPRWGHSFTAVGDAIYLFGGTTADGNTSNDVFEFLPKYNTFEPIHMRGEATSSAVEGNSASAVSAAPAAAGGGALRINSDATEPPSARCHHTAVAYQGRYLVIFGGQSARGSVLLNDVHILDTRRRTWRHCSSESSAFSPVGIAPNKNEPTGRYGHSAVVIGTKMYVFGGKAIKRGDEASTSSNTNAVTAAAAATNTASLGTSLSNDVYVFCLRTLQWKKRIHVSASSTAAATAGADGSAAAAAPARRLHHAACAIGDVMYVNGGEAAAGQLLADTWALDVGARAWRLVHSAPHCPPRSRHALFGCGEALLAVAGLAGGSGLSAFAASSSSSALGGGAAATAPLAVLAVTESCPDTGAVRTIPLSEMGGWIPVSLGAANANTIPSTNKSFGATTHNGFFFTFGGVASGSQPTADVTRCLAMDGVPPTESGDGSFAALQAQMRTLREDKALADLFLEGVADGAEAHAQHIADASSAAAAAAASSSTVEPPRVGLHKLILQHRAPLFYADVLACKSRGVYVTSRGAVTSPLGAAPAAASADGNAFAAATTAAAAAASSALNSVPSYAIAGGPRGAKGLSVAFTPNALKRFLDYLYCAEVPHKASDVTESEEGGVSGATDDLSILIAAAEAYSLANFASYLYFLRANSGSGSVGAAAAPTASASVSEAQNTSPARSHKAFKTARAEHLRTLRSELPSLFSTLLATGKGATASIVFEDKDTHLETTIAAHPLLLANSCEYFRQLLRPLLLARPPSSSSSASLGGGGDASSSNNNATVKQSHSCGGVTAKRTPNAAPTSKRSIVVAKVPIPRLGTRHVMRYLYTRDPSAVPPEDALMTMIAASGLGLFGLQTHCEAIVAREEVTFDTACAYITLAAAHKAPLLSELSILTAALGLLEPGLCMEASIPFTNLPPPTQAVVRSIAAQLQGKWAPPPQQQQLDGVAQQQDAAVYQGRMSSATGAGYGRRDSNGGGNNSYSASPAR